MLGADPLRNPFRPASKRQLTLIKSPPLRTSFGRSVVVLAGPTKRTGFEPNKS